MKALEEMLSIAKTNGNQITKEELLDYFSDIPMNEEAKNCCLIHMKKQESGSSDMKKRRQERKRGERSRRAERIRSSCFL